MTKRILIVEDEFIVSSEIQEYLQLMGHTVAGKAKTGQQAVEKAESLKPDLVLMDIGLKGAMDGVEAAEQIYSRFSIPVIYLTAHADVATVKRAKITGPFGYVVKPFDQSDLHSAIEIAQHRYELERKLRQTNAEIKELNALKDKFFSIISHDLKSPLFGIKGFTNMMIHTFDDLSLDELKDMITLLNLAVDNTYKLLENLLQWSQLQRGRMKFNPTNFNLTDLVLYVFHIHRPAANTKNITLGCIVDPELEVRADMMMIDTALRNLISNAIKFTESDGEVKVSAKVNDMVEISIKDTGVGICHMELEKLFHVDRKLKTEGTAGEMGTGLGLILCKELIEKNEGCIWVESEKGNGSTFKFTLQKTRSNA